MICPNCKRIIPNDVNFCRYCGENITSTQNVNDDMLMSEEGTSKGNTDISDTKDDVITEKKSSVKAFLLLCVIALAIAGALMYFRSGNETKFTADSLQHYTYIGKTSQLSMNVPFELKDTDPGVADSTISNIVYKSGVSGNFKVEVIGIQYNFDVSMLSTSDFINGFIDSLGDEKRIDNIEKVSAVNTSINGIPCTKQLFNYYDKQSKYNLQSLSVALKKDNEIWGVITGYKKGDMKASKFAEELVGSIKLE